MVRNLLDIKREKAEKVAPELRKLIRKHGFDAVRYAWDKAIQAQRQLERADAEAKAAKEKADKLRRELI